MFKRVLFLLSLNCSVFAGFLPASDPWIESLLPMVANHPNASNILDRLNETPGENREWVRSLFPMAANYRDLGRTVRLLNKTPTESQEWIKSLLPMVANHPDLSMIVCFLNKTPTESQEWVKSLFSMVAHHPELPGILNRLNETPGENREWVGSLFPMVANHPSLPRIVLSLNETPGENREWISRMGEFLIRPNEIFEVDRGFVIRHLINLTQNFCEPHLLEQVRIGLIQRVNDLRDRGENLNEESLKSIIIATRNEVTQNAEVDYASRPGRAIEIHYAASLRIPLEGGDRVPLYRAVEIRLRDLGNREETLTNSVTAIRNWINTHADADKKSLYCSVLSKGYGDGSHPEYNQEITPLLRIAVPYMATLPSDVRSAWLLTALQESATAYDTGSPLSCPKGIQERLCIVGFDVDGIDPHLRSLSKFARSFIYVQDPATHGADAWVRASVAHLLPAQRASLLEETRPEEEAFKAMFMPALQRAFEASGLLPLYTEALLNNSHTHQRFEESLEMHHGYDHHYAQLQAKVRELQTPEERPKLLAAAATSGLAQARPEEPKEE